MKRRSWTKVLTLLLLVVMFAVTAYAEDGNDYFETATVISTGRNYTNDIYERGDEDYYKFTIESQGYINLHFTHEPYACGDAYLVCLYNSDGDEMYLTSNRGDESSLKSPNIGVPAGTYFVKVTNARTQLDIDYNIQVNHISASNWETEFNDSFADADKLPLNYKMNGSIRNYGEADYYEFTVSSAGYISLTFNHELYDFGEAYKVYLLDSNGDQMFCDSNRCDVSTLRSPNIGVPAGTYFVMVTSSSYAVDIDYNIRIKYTSASNWETEFNESFSAADHLSTNYKMNGSMRDYGDVDYYKFRVDAAGDINLYFSHELYNCGDAYKVYLYDSNGDEIFFDYNRGDETSLISPDINVRAGAYYIKITYSTHRLDIDYSIEVNSISNEPTDPTPTEPTPTQPEPTQPSTPTEPSDSSYDECRKDSACPMARYGDCTLMAWYHNGIHFCIDLGLMNGTGATTFDPDDDTSRAMLVTILYRMEGAPSVSGLTEPFTDVTPNHWFYKAVVWAYNSGVVNGTSATAFTPDDSITREQLATILYRYDGAPTSYATLSGFVDANRVSNYARTAMGWAVENGLINGIMDNGQMKLAPRPMSKWDTNGNASRAQIATILMRYLEQ